MFKYVLKRLGLMLVTFMIITFITFLLIRALPRDLPMDTVQKEAILARWEALGYNEPLLKQFYIYVKNIVTSWDFGTSWYISYRTPAAEVLGGRLLPTVMINFYSIVFSVPVGILFGIYAAIQHPCYGVYIRPELRLCFLGTVFSVFQAWHSSAYHVFVGGCRRQLLHKQDVCEYDSCHNRSFLRLHCKLYPLRQG